MLRRLKGRLRRNPFGFKPLTRPPRWGQQAPMRVMEDIVHWNGGDHLGRPERDLFGRPSTQPTGGSSYTGVGWGALKSAVKSPFNVRWISLDFRCPSVGFPLKAPLDFGASSTPSAWVTLIRKRKVIKTSQAIHPISTASLSSLDTLKWGSLLEATSTRGQGVHGARSHLLVRISGASLFTRRQP